MSLANGLRQYNDDSVRLSDGANNQDSVVAAASAMWRLFDSAIVNQEAEVAIWAEVPSFELSVDPVVGVVGKIWGKLPLLLLFGICSWALLTDVSDEDAGCSHLL